MIYWNRAFKLCAGFCVLLSGTANADNEEFLAAVAEMPRRNTAFYNCSVEVGVEAVDPVCKSGCETRVFLRITKQQRPDMLLAGIFTQRNRQKYWLKSREMYYLAEFASIIGQPRISGVLRTGDDGRILALSFNVSDLNTLRYTVCFGVGTRQGREGYRR